MDTWTWDQVCTIDANTSRLCVSLWNNGVLLNEFILFQQDPENIKGIKMKH
jgi:hypothetical protein